MLCCRQYLTLDHQKDTFPWKLHFTVKSLCSLAREESMKISFEEQPFTETGFTG